MVVGATAHLFRGDTDHTHDFTLPVAITGVDVFCANVVASCHIDIVVLGS